MMRPYYISCDISQLNFPKCDSCDGNNIIYELRGFRNWPNHRKIPYFYNNNKNIHIFIWRVRFLFSHTNFIMRCQPSSELLKRMLWINMRRPQIQNNFPFFKSHIEKLPVRDVWFICVLLNIWLIYKSFPFSFD